MWKMLAECWSLPAEHANAQVRLLDRQLSTLFPIIPIGVVANALSALWVASTLWKDLPRTPMLVWVTALLLIHAGWTGHTLQRKKLLNRGKDDLYTRRDLWICAFWWACASGVVGLGLILGSPFAFHESQRLLLVSFAPGLIAGGVLFSMIVPLLATIWVVVLVPATAIGAYGVRSIDLAATRVLLAIYAVALCGAILAASKLFVGRFLAELIADRERQSAERLSIDLTHQKEIAEEANLAKSRFLAAASHDLRQPVHALSLFVGVLRGIPTNPDAERLISHIETSTSALDRLFTALLDISKLDAGVIEVHPQPFAIDAVLARTYSDYAGDATEKGLTISYVPNRSIVDSDPALVERIVRNLVSNAVRYTDNGKIVVGCRHRGAHLALQVWDTGRGIPHELRELVFQEYFQIGNPERNREQGIGLGLAIVRRVTKLLGSNITLRSEPGKGSCFEVLIPRTTSVAIPLDVPEPDDSNVASSGLIIVIDDEQAIRLGMSALLSAWGFDVLTAASTNEAIELLVDSTRQPALLICDFRLRNGENGIEAIERLRTEYNENIPAMLISGDIVAGRLLEAQSSGILLLHKPVPTNELRSAINALLLDTAHA
ncbi:hybrid sensor histidine kinase/response regulator [Paraburkholderia bryophila]|uniref:ATP-binding response regulator n=1 Tax=Paraburkholderia bryophila TaxID=420952 RepID=UPI00234A8ECE|nr:hybrid sensor histidine kinase/response regulator [Paraburkholderia bryophila]WCM22586.1 hybrid sensor histidine kinase/response regulator [Paraburkholderia bryophila]